jgi:hypothetical protein
MAGTTIEGVGNPSAIEEFRLKEYEALREEVIKRYEEMWKLEKFALGGAAAMAAWLLTHVKDVATGPLAWWLPFVFLFICTARFAAGFARIGARIYPYLMQIESQFLGNAGGFTTWNRKQGKTEWFAHVFVWVVALLAAVVLPCIYGSRISH